MLGPSGSATLLGVLGLGCVVTWPLLRSHGKALAVQGIGAVAFAAHFALLGALTASASCGLSLIQLTIAASIRDRRIRQALNVLMLVALLLLTIATWHGIASALVACGSLVGMFARCQRSMAKMKIIFIMAAPFWLAHHLIVGAPFALAVDLISVAGNLMGLHIAARRMQGDRAVPFPRLAITTRTMREHALPSRAEDKFNAREDLRGLPATQLAA